MLLRQFCPGKNQPQHQKQTTFTHGYAKAQDMQIVGQKADIKEHYADVFEGVGCFPGPPHSSGS